MQIYGARTRIERKKCVVLLAVRCSAKYVKFSVEFGVAFDFSFWRNFTFLLYDAPLIQIWQLKLIKIAQNSYSIKKFRITSRLSLKITSNLPKS